MLFTSVVATVAMNTAIVIQDQSSMLSAPKDSARQQAILWSGELVEVRGEKQNYLQIYDYKRERPGYILKSKVKTLNLSEQEAPQLLSALRYVQYQDNSEALSIGIAAAWLQSATTNVINGSEGAEVFNILGLKAQQLADKASRDIQLGNYAATRQAAYFDVVKGYGVKFNSYEYGDKIRVCYDGEAFRRVLALPATDEQKADAALALTRSECSDPNLSVTDKQIVNQWQADIVDKVDDTKLPAWKANQIKLRRAIVWSNLAFRRTRMEKEEAGKTATMAAENAIVSLAGVNKEELIESDLKDYNNAIMAVNASRWALLPKNDSPLTKAGKNLYVEVIPKKTGESCVTLLDEKHSLEKPLAQRCTFSKVWLSSATKNKENTALSIAVQPTEQWRELWVFYKKGDNWDINILPPAPSTPDIGYAEFAGWVPGGKKILVAQEARSEGKYYPARYIIMDIGSLTAERQHNTSSELGAFKRWQDPSWKQQSVSIR